MRDIIHFTGIFIIIGLFLIGCDAVISTDDNDLALMKGQGQAQSVATLSVATDVTGDPVADGWEFGGNLFDPEVFVRGNGEFDYDIYTTAFIISSGSPLIGDGWEEGDIVFGLGGVINPNGINSDLTHSVRIVSKFSAGNDTWSAGGTGSFSGAGGEGALLLATRGPLSPSGNTKHLNPFGGYGGSRVPTEFIPGMIYEIPMLQRVENGIVNTNAGTEAGKFIYLSNGPDYTDGNSGGIAPLLSSWQVFVNVSLLDDAVAPVPQVGHRAVQAMQRSTGRSIDGLVTIPDFAPLNPITIDDCKKGGWQQYGFRNQGRCIQFVNTGRDSR